MSEAIYTQEQMDEQYRSGKEWYSRQLKVIIEGPDTPKEKLKLIADMVNAHIKARDDAKAAKA